MPSKTVSIHITAEDIRIGRRASCWSCPIALACRRAFDVHAVSVSPSCITIYITSDYGIYEEYKLPFDVAAKLVMYDETGEMEPFTFVVGA